MSYVEHLITNHESSTSAQDLGLVPLFFVFFLGSERRMHAVLGSHLKKRMEKPSKQKQHVQMVSISSNLVVINWRPMAFKMVSHLWKQRISSSQASAHIKCMSYCYVIHKWVLLKKSNLVGSRNEGLC